MQNFYRDIIKHSAVYGAGQVLSRLAAFVLLPVYTSYLRPADYGVIAILDLVAVIFAIMIGSGMGSAVNRHYFDAKDDDGRSQVWWAGLFFVLITGSVFVIPAMFFRDVLAVWTLGPEINRGEFYYGLILMTMWLNVIGQFLDGYLRVRKWSGFSVGVNLFCLMLNISLNLFFLAVWQLGITGILTGNLITGVVGTLIRFGIFVGNQKFRAFDSGILEKLLKFGAPLVLTGLLASLMHQLDRYLLRLFLDMDQVGIYSVAYTIGQGVNTLCLLPFHMIWSVLMFEIAKHENAKQIYVQVFQYFVFALALVILGVSLVSNDLVTLMVASDFSGSAPLIPIVGLGYLFFSLHEHFQVPVMLAKRTVTLLPVISVAVLVNFSANLLLIPKFGIYGAAWATVITFATYSFFGLWRYRRIDIYNYPLARCGVILIGMAASYMVYDWILQVPGETGRNLAFAALIWSVWLGILFWGPFQKLLRPMIREREKVPITLDEIFEKK